MCGIVGFVQNQPLLDRTRLLRMRDTLEHRGPDGAGMEMWSDRGENGEEGGLPVAGFGHRRLSIIDLSEAGHQPMSNEDGTVWITYNGEFYNFGDYRAELESQGHVFRSRCDTETILHLYESHGMEETLRRMNGMFAFGLYDAGNKKLILARDRVGKKPLYYMVLPGGGVMFASEIKALLQSGLVDADRLDPVAMVQVWTFGYTYGERTIYEQIKQLPAGHWAEWSEGRLEIREYWDCPFGMDEREPDHLDVWADELEAILCDAIRIRLISDVPLGLFLSGGVDSSLVTALVAKRLQCDLHSFTIGFRDARFDESPFATDIARHLGVHNEMLVVDGQMEPSFPRIARHFDMPFGDSSSIPTYFVSKAARSRVTVALTGDGGDELFGGYDWYERGLRVLEPAMFEMAVSSGLAQRLWEFRLKWFGVENGFAMFCRLMGPKGRRRILRGEPLAAVNLRTIYSERKDWHDRVRGADRLAQMQYLDMKTYLTDDILVKVDRMSMANSLECRSPLLDYRVVEFASRLPRHAKTDGAGYRKRILAHLLERYVPRQLFARPKQGFSVPWKTWCDGEMRRNLKTEWEQLDHPWLRPDASAYLFPGDAQAPVSMQWLAYTMMMFMNAHSASRKE